MARDNNVHDRHEPAADEDFDAAAGNSKTDQEIRDAHFLEHGVNAEGKTQAKVSFDAEGNEE